MLSDDEWAQIAADILHRTGLSPYGQEDDAVRWVAVRWVAVRHGADHIHIVAMLARQDGGKPRLSNERYRTAARRAAEHLPYFGRDHRRMARTAQHAQARDRHMRREARPADPAHDHASSGSSACPPIPASADQPSGPAIPDTGPLDFPSYAERQGHACLGKARLSVGGR